MLLLLLEQFLLDTEVHLTILLPVSEWIEPGWYVLFYRRCDTILYEVYAEKGGS